MAELTANFKYIFLDIVKFTKDRSVEAQSDVICQLNKIVKESVQHHSLKEDNVIYIPTGDGICIAMRGELSYDMHMLISLHILATIETYNQTQGDQMRRFGVRIGINENVDNVIEDINGRKNVAGSGINYASRVMDYADKGQILIGQAVYDILCAREKYMGSFRSYKAKIKHGLEIPVHQFIQANHLGLDTNVPSNLVYKKTVYLLSRQAAYYFAHAISNRELLIRKTEKESQAYYTPVILLWFLAHDSDEMSKCKDFDSAHIKQPGKGKLSFEEQFDLIDKTNLSIVFELAGNIVDSHLEKYYRESFEDDIYGMKCWFIINKDGQVKLKKEHPDIWQEFHLDDYV